MRKDPRPAGKKREVLFVCTVNRHRSVMAEHLFRRMVADFRDDLKNRIGITSAGIVTPEQKSELRSQGIGVPRPLYGYRPMPCLILHMQKAGMDVSKYRSKSITKRMAADSDLIIAMGESHKEAILNMYPRTAGRVFTLAELSHPFEFKDIIAEEPPGLMPPAKFCMLQCDHWSVTGIVLRQCQERLDEAFEEIIALLGLKT